MEGYADSTQNVATVNTATLNLEKNIDTATGNFEKKINMAIQKAIERSSELANGQSALRKRQDDSMSALNAASNDIATRLAKSDQLLARYVNFQQSLEEGAERLATSLAHIESKAEAIGATQSQQAEMMATVFDRFQAEMQTTQGYLDEATVTTMRLQEIISGTIPRIESLAAVSEMFSTLFDWTILIGGAVSLALLAAVLRTFWRFNRFIACCFLAAISEFSGISRHDSANIGY